MSESAVSEYRTRIYSSYYSAHMKTLYGDVSIEDIKRQFDSWEYYYGHCLPDDKEVEIIEIGCGNGGFVYWLNEKGYKNVRGIDVSPEQVEVANKLGIKNVFRADLREILIKEENKFHLIFARDVLEHFRKEEVLDTLQTINNALTKGGFFVLQTPNGVSPFSGRHRYKDFTHEVVFTRDSLNQVLQTTGFRDVEYYSTPPVPKGPVSVIRYILWKSIETALRFYLAAETGFYSEIFTQNIIAKAKK